MKKTLLRLLALALTLCLVLSMAACGGNEDEEEEPGLPRAELGGQDVPYPEGFDTTAKRASAVNGDTLCLAFNGIMTFHTGYFQPAGDSVTLTAAATTEYPGQNSNLKGFKAALWQKTEDGRIYVEGCTLVFAADGELYTGTFSGLDPEQQYRLTLSYDSGYYTISGGMSVEGLATAEDAPEEGQDA